MFALVFKILLRYSSYMTKLRDLVEIRSGYTFREGIGSLSPGDTEVFQSGDLNDDIDFADRPCIAFQGSRSHLLQKGDVLVSARGILKAYTYHSQKPAVASSSILVLRAKQSRILPEYITTFFNSTVGFKAYLRLASSNTLTTITKADLGEIEIPDIPVDSQQALGKLVDTIDTERRRLGEKMIYLDHIRAAAINKTLKEYV